MFKNNLYTKKGRTKYIKRLKEQENSHTSNCVVVKIIVLTGFELQ